MYQSDRTYEGAGNTNLRRMVLLVLAPWLILVLIVVATRAMVPAADVRLGNQLNGDAIRGGGDPVLVSAATEFDWDRVCMFRPLTPMHAIEAKLELDWAGLVHDVFPTLIFVSGDQVARYAYVRPRSLDELPADGVCFGRDDATVRWRPAAENS